MAGAGLSLERLLGPGGIPGTPREETKPPNAQCTCLDVGWPRGGDVGTEDPTSLPWCHLHAAWLKMESRHPLPGHPQQSGRKWAGHGRLAQDRGSAEGAGPGLGLGRSRRGQAEDLRLWPQPEAWCKGTETGLSQATSSEHGQGVARTHWAVGPRVPPLRPEATSMAPNQAKGGRLGGRPGPQERSADLTRVSPPPPVAPSTSKTQCLTAPSPSDHKAQQRPQRSNLTWESPPPPPPSGPQGHALP